MERYKRLLLIFVILCLSGPLIQSTFDLFPVAKLNGDVRLVGDTSISRNAWFDAGYQAAKEKYLNENFGGRNLYVRLRNELSYLVFDKVYAKEVIGGKSGFLYEQKYLEAHAGMDFVGNEQVNKLFKKVKFVQDTLQKLGITFAILFAPGKATFYPEYIPAPYNVEEQNTNYIKFTEAARESGVNCIDYNAWFLRMKPNAKYPLYPKTGTHWSIYGMHLALDTLVRYIEQKTHKNLKHFDYSQVVLSDSLRHPDGDIAKGLNLLHEPSHFTMAYPLVKWTDTAGAFRPRVLTVADSYWMGVYFTELPQTIFAQHEFWYYNKMLYNYDPQGKTFDPSDRDLKTSIEKNNCVFIVSTEASLKRMGWGIIDELYNLYNDGPFMYELSKKYRKKTAELDQIKNTVWGDPTWFAQVKKQAKQLGISLDSCANMNAEFYYNEKHKNDPPVLRSAAEEMQERILRIKTKMLKSKEWYNYLVDKAQKMHITLDSCMGMDARWTAGQDIYNERVTFYKEQIKRTPNWLKDVTRKALENHISTDSSITLDAIYMAKQELKK